MSKFYEVTVAIEVSIQKNGKPKIQKEVYLVDSESVTEAESRVVKDFVDAGSSLDFKVVGARESKIRSVIG